MIKRYFLARLFGGSHIGGRVDRIVQEERENYGGGGEGGKGNNDNGEFAARNGHRDPILSGESSFFIIMVLATEVGEV